MKISLFFLFFYSISIHGTSELIEYISIVWKNLIQLAHVIETNSICSRIKGNYSVLAMYDIFEMACNLIWLVSLVSKIAHSQIRSQKEIYVYAYDVLHTWILLPVLCFPDKREARKKADENSAKHRNVRMSETDAMWHPIIVCSLNSFSEKVNFHNLPLACLYHTWMVCTV